MLGRADDCTLHPGSEGAHRRGPACTAGAFENAEFVYRFELRTSRFARVVEHVGAYRDAPVGDVFVDDPAAFATLQAGLAPLGVLRSDEICDACARR
jgi:hypothetical protein